MKRVLQQNGTNECTGLSTKFRVRANYQESTETHRFPLARDAACGLALCKCDTVFFGGLFHCSLSVDVRPPEGQFVCCATANANGMG